VGNEGKDGTSKDFSVANETGTGHEAYAPASYMKMTMMMMMQNYRQ